MRSRAVSRWTSRSRSSASWPMPPGALRAASRRSDRSAIDCARLSAMAAKCASSPPINAGSALAAHVSAREKALGVGIVKSGAPIPRRGAGRAADSPPPRGPCRKPPGPLYVGSGGGAHSARSPGPVHRSGPARDFAPVGRSPRPADASSPLWSGPCRFGSALLRFPAVQIGVTHVGVTQVCVTKVRAGQVRGTQLTSPACLRTWNSADRWSALHTPSPCRCWSAGRPSPGIASHEATATTPRPPTAASCPRAHGPGPEHPAR